MQSLLDTPCFVRRWLLRSAAGLGIVLAIGLAPGLAAQVPGISPSPEEPAAEGEPAPAAEATAEPARSEPAAPFPYQDELQRDTPRGAMRGFLTAAREGDWERAARYLDLSRLPGDERAAAGPELARDLKRVLDRRLWVDLEALADRPEGDRDDALPADRDRLGTIELANGRHAELLLAQGRDEGERVWRVAAATLAQVPELYEELGYGPLDDWLPQPFFDLQFLDIQLWQWIGLALLLVLVWAASWGVAWLLLKILAPLARRSLTEVDDHLMQNGAPPLRLLTGLGLFTLGILALRLAVPVEAFFIRLVQALVVLAVVWLAFRLVDIFSHWSSARLTERGQIAATAMLPLVRKSVKVFLGALGLLAVLQNVGVNVTALLAGLGVGGLAVAFAAQKTLENFFGGITLVVDQPVRVGDFCKFGDQVGTVESIGLRSTRIRTLDRTLVTIPNGDFSQMKLENYAKRDRILMKFLIGLRYETTPDQMRYLLVEIRRLLYAHPKVTPDPARIRFVGFGAHSLDLEVFAYGETSDFNEFLAIREDVLLRMMEVVEASGTGFAFPSQTLYMERGGGVDAQRTAEAEERVRQWREAGDLQLPQFRQEEIDRIDDTLDYPPRGSAVRVEEPQGEI
ncbi:MAG TPA: mechanosensitive ion channel family protein [Thermoanaerobaculia bacterium]|nr:mechanosensitive ion channel family protein [Thermoanaerobaculia bacterium]